jgi:hypothetical protein
MLLHGLNLELPTQPSANFFVPPPILRHLEMLNPRIGEKRTEKTTSRTTDQSHNWGHKGPNAVWLKRVSFFWAAATRRDSRYFRVTCRRSSQGDRGAIPGPRGPRKIGKLIDRLVDYWSKGTNSSRCLVISPVFGAE